jgi:hypothetical protein
MKPYVQFLLTLVVMIPVVTLGDVVGVPFFITVVIFFCASNQLMFLFNSRASRKLWPIPERGYDRRREAMEADEHLIFNLGFQKVDEFYLKTISDAVVYVYKHRSEPVELCLYHLGINRACDFITRFEGDITVTTATAKSAGAVKRPPRRLLQIVPGESYDTLLEKHRSAIAFLCNHGISPVNPPASAFRALFVNSMQEFYNRGRSERFFLLRFFGGLLTASGQNYRLPLERQYPSGLTLDVLTG